MTQNSDSQRRGRMIALVIAGVGLFWIGAIALGDAMDWTQRTRALFDLVALAGFGWALWLVYGFWRNSRQDKD